MIHTRQYLYVPYQYDDDVGYGVDGESGKDGEYGVDVGYGVDGAYVVDVWILV